MRIVTWRAEATSGVKQANARPKMGGEVRAINGIGPIRLRKPTGTTTSEVHRVGKQDMRKA